MTELFPIAIDLQSTHDRIATYRDTLHEALPVLKAEVAGCILEIDQANQLIVGVDRLQAARDALLMSIETAAPSLQALFGAMSAGAATGPAAPVEEPRPVAEPEEPDTSTVLSPAVELAPVEKSVEEDEPAQEQTDVGLPADERLSPATQRVLDILQRSAGPDGVCRMSARELSEKAGVKLSTARVGIFPKLKALGLARAENTEDGWVYHVTPIASAGEGAAPQPAATAVAPVDDPAPAIGTPAPVGASPSPAATSSQVAKQGRDLMAILRKAPLQEDGSAIFMSSAIAKRMAVTEHRIDQLLEHLETIDQIEIQSCGLKGHFRISVTSAGRVAS